MDWIDWLSKAVVVGFVGLAWFNTRSTLNRVCDKIEKIVQTQTECRVDLPRMYATKTLTDELFRKTDDLEKSVSFMQGQTCQNRG